MLNVFMLFGVVSIPTLIETTILGYRQLSLLKKEDGKEDCMWGYIYDCGTVKVTDWSSLVNQVDRRPSTW